jgi:hypothetical protein
VDSELDALQNAATGTLFDDVGAEEPRIWAPLVHLIAEGPKTVLADLVDPPLERLSEIARRQWGLLIGRGCAAVFCGVGNPIAEDLRGFDLSQVIAATTGKDWSSLDLAQVYAKTKAKLNNRGDPARVKRPASGGKHGAEVLLYGTEDDVRDALIVAQAVMTLRGFPGNGKGMLPWVLQQVMCS